ncbi:creatininase family protein [Candidatus Sumerlaeota bacterium]|nr:creatininase family protein [Candidatus Sumerlaeota bacterium]
MTWQEVGSVDREVVVLIPTGSLEQHGPHLPLFTDSLLVTSAAAAIEQRIPDKVLLLPTVWLGCSGHHLPFSGSLSASFEGYEDTLIQIVESLIPHGFNKFFVINGHGGNDFTPLVRQIQCDLDVHVFVCDWWKVGLDRYDEIFAQPEDHAGEMETSVAMALFPDLVEMDRAADGRTRPFRFEALRQGWVRTSRDFSKLNDHCAAGDPSAATAEKGQKYLDLICARIGDFLVELAGTPIDENFPLEPEDSASP